MRNAGFINNRKRWRPFITYLLKFGGIFLFFYFGTLLIIGLSSKENSYSPFVSAYFDYITPLRYSILWAADNLLQAFNYSTFWTDKYTLGIRDGQSVRIVYSCIGYGVLSFWAAFVLANGGSAIKKGVWLMGGWLLLWCLNVLRIYFLIIAVNKAGKTPLAIDHHTLFNIVAYSFIFLMILFYDRSQKRGIQATVLQ